MPCPQTTQYSKPWQQLQRVLTVWHVPLQADLHGVLPVHKGQFDSLQQNALPSVKQALTVTFESTDCVACAFTGSSARRAASAQGPD